jgi:hypothetical protein
MISAKIMPTIPLQQAFATISYIRIAYGHNTLQAADIAVMMVDAIPCAE